MLQSSTRRSFDMCKRKRENTLLAAAVFFSLPGIIFAKDPPPGCVNSCKGIIWMTNNTEGGLSENSRSDCWNCAGHGSMSGGCNGTGPFGPSSCISTGTNKYVFLYSVNGAPACSLSTNDKYVEAEEPNPHPSNPFDIVTSTWYNCTGAD